MDAEQAGHAGGHGLARGLDGGLHGGEVVADQGGGEAGGAIGAVGGADAGDLVHGRRVGEEGAAAAVDLGVDEAGREVAAAEIAALRIGGRVGRVDQAHDAPAADQQGLARDKACVGMDRCVEKGGIHQTVSVTLLRWGGWSGS